MANSSAHYAYIRFLGKSYCELLKDNAFLAAIGGNVPEKVGKDSKSFHILSPSNNVSFTFDSDSNALKFVSLSPNQDGSFVFGLTTGINEEQAAEMFGQPIDGKPAQKVPLLGMVGAWRTHIVEGNKLTLMYSVDTGCLAKIRFTL